jgi:hypothetical protein
LNLAGDLHVDVQYVGMKKKLLVIILVLSLLGNVALTWRAYTLANRLSEAYEALNGWYEFYESLPRGTTIYLDD